MTLPDNLDLTEDQVAQLQALLRAVFHDDVADAAKWMGQYSGPIRGKPLEALKAGRAADVIAYLRKCPT